MLTEADNKTPIPGAPLLDEHGDKMPFGEHAGKRMQDVPRQHLLELWNTGFHEKTGDQNDEGAVARYINNNMGTICSAVYCALSQAHASTVPAEFRSDVPPPGAPGAPGTPEAGNVGELVPVGEKLPGGITISVRPENEPEIVKFHGPVSAPPES